ncbi:hypothetical protein Tco_0571377 [Tanacetum coccineum]
MSLISRSCLNNSEILYHLCLTSTVRSLKRVNSTAALKASLICTDACLNESTLQLELCLVCLEMGLVCIHMITMDDGSNGDGTGGGDKCAGGAMHLARRSLVEGGDSETGGDGDGVVMAKVSNLYPLVEGIWYLCLEELVVSMDPLGLVCNPMMVGLLAVSRVRQVYVTADEAEDMTAAKAKITYISITYRKNRYDMSVTTAETLSTQTRHHTSNHQAKVNKARDLRVLHLARITEAHFEDERPTTTIAKPNDLNIGIQVQHLEKTTFHKSNKVEETYLTSPDIVVAEYLGKKHIHDFDETAMMLGSQGKLNEIGCFNRPDVQNMSDKRDTSEKIVRDEHIKGMKMVKYVEDKTSDMKGCDEVVWQQKRTKQKHKYVCASKCDVEKRHIHGSDFGFSYFSKTSTNHNQNLSIDSGSKLYFEDSIKKSSSFK